MIIGHALTGGHPPAHGKRALKGELWLSKLRNRSRRE